MYNLYKNGFVIGNSQQFNSFVKEIIVLGEAYIKFLVSKNRLYLPLHIESKDAAIDLLAEIFNVENNIIIKFRNFFDSKFDFLLSELQFENYLKGFIAKIIQNNLINFYRDNDHVTYHIYRNVKEAAAKLGLNIEVHFTDKYLLEENADFKKNIPERDDLYDIANKSGLHKYALQTRVFIENLFNELKYTNEYTAAVRLSDLTSLLKSLLSSNAAHFNNADLSIYSPEDRFHLNFVFDNVSFSYSEKLNKYVSKNGLPKSFYDSMYNLIDEVISDYRECNTRRSVKELQKTYFQNEDKKLFYKIQYCIEILENEIAKNIIEEKKLIG
jgi:hypothetical protein